MRESYSNFEKIWIVLSWRTTFIIFEKDMLPKLLKEVFTAWVYYGMEIFFLSSRKLYHNLSHDHMMKALSLCMVKNM